MSYIKDRIFVFDIETVIDIESSRSFLGLNSEACKSEIAEKIKKYHVESSFSGSDFVKPPFHKIVAISYLDANIYADNERRERYKIFNIKSGGNIDSEEEELVKGFFDYLEKVDAILFEKKTVLNNI